MVQSFRRQRLLPIKFKTLAFGLIGLACIGTVNKKMAKDVLQVAEIHSRELLAVSDFPEGIDDEECNCTNCYAPMEYLFVCCDTNSTLCLTEHHDVCPESELCAAELIPGGSGAAECLLDWELQGGVVLHIFILLYIFLGLAIVCDDYFVPSLEKISNGLKLSPDVAGATFMAAGSSAPELFVSLADNVIANPPKSIGIGTIVGSAIFNILVIIGLSGVLAGQALALDWHPLARDSIFYTLSIVLMVVAVYDGKVEWYEGLILLIAYGAYVLFMVFNQRFFDGIDRLLGVNSKADAALLEAEVDALNKKGDTLLCEEESTSAASLVNGTELAIENEKKVDLDVASPQPFAHTLETSRPTEAVDAARDALSRRRRESDSHVVFPKSDTKQPRSRHNPMHLAKFRSDWSSMSSFDSKSTKTFRETAEQIMAAKNAGKIWMQVTKDNKAQREKDTEAQRNANRVGDQSTEEENEGLGPYWEPLMWPVLANEEGKPKRSWISRACCDWHDLWDSRMWYIMTLPLNLLFRTTIPDCNHDLFCEDKPDKEENRKVAYSLSFFMCVVWIALLSHLVTYSAAKFGCIVGISPPVMGLTILAAGTSVPDALSSIIVARNGEGDMAVANSIGSNVFDILIGLGFPWLIAPFVYSRPSEVKIDDLWVGIAFLFGVLVFLVGIIMANRWILRKRVGALLLSLYVFYVIFQLFIAPLVN